MAFLLQVPEAIFLLWHRTCCGLTFSLWSYEFGRDWVERYDFACNIYEYFSLQLTPKLESSCSDQGLQLFTIVSPRGLFTSTARGPWSRPLKWLPHSRDMVAIMRASTVCLASCLADSSNPSSNRLILPGMVTIAKFLCGQHIKGTLAASGTWLQTVAICTLSASILCYGETSSCCSAVRAS